MIYLLYSGKSMPGRHRLVNVGDDLEKSQIECDSVRSRTKGLKWKKGREEKFYLVTEQAKGIEEQ